MEANLDFEKLWLLSVWLIVMSVYSSPPFKIQDSTQYFIQFFYYFLSF